MSGLNKIESAVFLYCRSSLFLKDPFFQIILKTILLFIESGRFTLFLLYVWKQCNTIKKHVSRKREMPQYEIKQWHTEEEAYQDGQTKMNTSNSSTNQTISTVYEPF